jgi:cytochrome P450
MSLTDPIITMLTQFRPVFTAPTWKKMLIQMSGTILARGRRTVTAAFAKQAINTIRTLVCFTTYSIERAGCPGSREAAFVRQFLFSHITH